MDSRTIDLEGPVHYADFGGAGPPLVLVHGLGGSHVNWISSGPLLARRGRVLAPDLAGFGRTPLSGRNATLDSQQKLLDRFIDDAAGGRAILVGNSMGGLVAMLEAARHPEKVEALVLAAPAQPRPPSGRVDGTVAAMFALYSIPWMGELAVRFRAERAGPERLVMDMLELCCVDRTRISEEAILAHVALTKERFATTPSWPAPFIEAARSILSFVLRPTLYRGIVTRITSPTLLVQGSEDRLVPMASSRELARQRPDWTFLPLEGVGHVPQLEVASLFVESVLTWLDGAKRASA